MRSIPWYVGMTWVGRLNFLLLQWFFVRLGYHQIEVNGVLHRRRYHLIWGIVPLTGWWSDYRFVGRKR